ncbi:MAG: hypothetical protein MK101_04605 [Phycisphaerales bacterium]|nr:hypothetical protein [Phycisphaerales bacterium]
MQCPFCDSICTPSQVRFVAAQTLVGDPVLGTEHALRFRTAHFANDGAAIAPDGTRSTTPACPACRGAWHPLMTGFEEVHRIDVGPGGIDRALEGCSSWQIDCIKLDGPPNAHDTDQAAAVVVCVKDDERRIYLLTTRTGSPNHLSQTLSGAPLS